MRRRLLWLAAGVVALLVALMPAVDAAADLRLSAHMLQHLLLVMVAAPALAAAGPIGLALRGVDRAVARRAIRALRSPAARRLVHPVTTTAVFALTLAVVHLPAVYEAALRHPLAHGVEHAALFWTAVLFWLPLVGRDPLPRPGAVARLTSGLLGMAAMVLVGGVISATPHELYATYASAGGASALADQQLAGGIMATGGMVIMLPLLLWSTWSALAAEERREQARERRADRLAEGAPSV